MTNEERTPNFLWFCFHKELRAQIIFDENWNYRPKIFNFKKPEHLASGSAMTVGTYDPGFEIVDSRTLTDAISKAFEDYRCFPPLLKDAFMTC